MAKKFFASFEQAQPEKYHGKPLIRRGRFSSSAFIVIRNVLLSIVFVAAVDLAVIGLIALTSAPLWNSIFGN